MNTVHVHHLTLGGKGAPLFLIAGPCVIESESLLMQTAESLTTLCRELKIPFIFKCSFDKANRTAGTSFRGPGLKSGVASLLRVRDTFDVPVLTDVHQPDQCAAAADAGVDVLQIPAFLCRQTDLLEAAARTGQCVNIKKGQFLAPWDIRHAIDKVTASGGQSILVTERGSSFGYGNLVVDMRGIPMMRSYGWPVVFDATHSVQIPGGGMEGSITGGDRTMAPILARAAVAAGCDGVFVETHPEPDHAKSDAANQIPLAGMKSLMESLTDIHAAAATPSS